MLAEKLVYIGRIIKVESIPNAEFIESVTVVCGSGGKWQGIVTKGLYSPGHLCVVYMPDALIPESDEMRFMENTQWRVKMRKFLGFPSEVVVMPCDVKNHGITVGTDITQLMNVQRYLKPIPACLNARMIAHFPGFIPKTDEPNYQRAEDQIQFLEGKPFYISMKADGSSTTAFKYKGQFGLCSRNYQLAYQPDNGYWKVADKYNLKEKLPDGIAIQWETCGPNIQSNRWRLTEIEGYVFSGYNIEERRYLTCFELRELVEVLGMKSCEILRASDKFSWDEFKSIKNKIHRNLEGVVVRSQENLLGTAPVSFKIINLSYEK